MSYLGSHQFEPYHDPEALPDSRPYCGMPRGDKGICADYADHPIHGGNSEVERIARALATRKWRDESGDWSVHARHNYSADCALCRQDVHAIAAAVLEIQERR